MTEYYVKRTAEGAEVFKDDFDSPFYIIKNSQCSCPGCVYHKVRCKHLKWIDAIATHPAWQIGAIFELDSLGLVPWEPHI